jgi:FkbH-like protein
MKVALAGDVALDLLAPYFREAGFEVYVPAGFGTWRQELLDSSSGLRRFAPDFIFDVTAHDKALSEEVDGFFDERMRRLASMPYSLAGIKAIVDEFEFFRRAAPKKVLAVDADNTLWRGILSEDGRDALSPCVEFQRGLKALRDEGVILVLLTKNDPSDSFIRGDMPLSDADFAVRRINWAPKAGNLIEACRELNVGLDSVVFVDDNPHERAQMAAHLPEVVVVPWNGWGEDVSRLPCEARALLRRLREYFFSDVGKTAEDRIRASSYRAEAAARETRASFSTVGDYLKSLDLRVSPRLAEDGDIPRLAQMAGKTNQFNATTIRRSGEDFARLLSDRSKRVFVFSTSDRFGEQGLVCYVVVDLESRRITDFVMSCRAMGRTLEHFAYGHVARSIGYPPAIDFSPSAKNAPFGEFLANLKPEMDSYYEAR